jgi:hypothetical protein
MAFKADTDQQVRGIISNHFIGEAVTVRPEIDQLARDVVAENMEEEEAFKYF